MRRYFKKERYLLKDKVFFEIGPIFKYQKGVSQWETYWTDQYNKGLISEDRNNKATLPLTIPCYEFKSSTNDLPLWVTLFIIWTLVCKVYLLTNWKFIEQSINDI